MDTRTPNTKLKRERELRGWSQKIVAEHIGTNIEAVSRWERGYHTPERYYQEKLCVLFGKNAEELGFINTQPTIGALEKSTHQNSATILISPTLPNLLMQSRRQFLQGTLNTACATLMLSPYTFLTPDGKERLEKSLIHPSYLDDAALADLATINTRYWALCKNTSIDLLSGISGHFATIVQLLKDTHPTHVYQQLCSQASEAALILGKTFHDMKEYDLAWQYYHFSLKVAQDVQNTDLWANSIGRIALLFIYWGEPQNALPLLQQAAQTDIPHQRTRAWLSAIEAEIHASHGDYDTCLRKINTYKSITLPTSLGDDRYATGFNQSRAAGYEGACFIRLHKPELALPYLQQALALSEATSIRRHSTLLTDIGAAHAQLGNITDACKLMKLALDMTMQTKSMVVLHRIYRVRRELDQWSETSEVKSLDEQMKEAHRVLNKLKEQEAIRG